jgi:large subunit ribosomal protein L28
MKDLQAMLDALAPLPYTSALYRPHGSFTAAGAYRRRAQEFRGLAMSRKCDLTGKSALVGHKVSHSNRKTKRRFLPNLVNVTLTSEALSRAVRLRVSTNALKTVDHRGGLDAFLMKASDDDLAPKALELKRALKKKLAAAS